MAPTPARDDNMIAALLREREVYLAHGKTDRAAEVTAQLELRGHTDPAPEPVLDPDGAPRGRATAPARTADTTTPVADTADTQPTDGSSAPAAEAPAAATPAAKRRRRTAGGHGG